MSMKGEVDEGGRTTGGQLYGGRAAVSRVAETDGREDEDGGQENEKGGEGK